MTELAPHSVHVRRARCARLRRYLTSCILAVMLATSACGYDPNRPSAEQQARATEFIRSLPPLEDAEKLLHEAMKEVTATTTGLDPAVQWYREGIRGLDTLGLTAECGRPNEEIGGFYTEFDDLKAEEPISSSNWPRLLEVARLIARILGGPEPQVSPEEPRSYERLVGIRFVSVTDSSRTMRLRISTDESYRKTRGAKIEADTGCRMPRAVKASSIPGSLGPTTTARPTR